MTAIILKNLRTTQTATQTLESTKMKTPTMSTNSKMVIKIIVGIKTTTRNLIKVITPSNILRIIILLEILIITVDMDNKNLREIMVGIEKSSTMTSKKTQIKVIATKETKVDIE